MQVHRLEKAMNTNSKEYTFSLQTRIHLAVSRYIFRLSLSPRTSPRGHFPFRCPTHCDRLVFERRTIDQQVRSLLLRLVPLLQHLISLLVLLFVFLVLGSVILPYICREEAEGDPEDEEEPEDVDGLEHRQQCKGDDLTNPAFVLLRFPVQLEWSDGAELGQDGPQNAQIEPVTHIDPDTNEETKVGLRQRVVQVVENLGRLRASLVPYFPTPFHEKIGLPQGKSPRCRA